jgi:cobalt/nickel transport system permease protein
MAVFVATFSGSLCTYSITALQLALAFPSDSGSVMLSFGKFITVFGLTQIPLSVIEGLISIMVFSFINSNNKIELLAFQHYK